MTNDTADRMITERGTGSELDAEEVSVYANICVCYRYTCTYMHIQGGEREKEKDARLLRTWDVSVIGMVYATLCMGNAKTGNVIHL